MFKVLITPFRIEKSDCGVLSQQSEYYLKSLGEVCELLNELGPLYHFSVSNINFSTVEDVLFDFSIEKGV